MLVSGLERAIGTLGLRGRGVLVAVSGGIDSIALIHGLYETTRESHLNLSIGHVNHGLRGEESEADEQAVRAAAAKLAVPFACRSVVPETLREDVSSRARPTLQEAARTLRYRALRGMARELGADVVATAHTADDQAETVLLRLLRGTGADGLGGIPERSSDGHVVRPLLRVTRAEVEQYAAETELSWREDRSNHSDAYARNRLRRHWLPGLSAEFNPRLLRAIADLAEAQRRDSDWIDDLVGREAAARFEERGGWLRIDHDSFEALPEALARRLARWGLRRCGGARDTSRVHLERMLEFFRTGRVGTAMELPGGVLLRRDREGFRLGPIAPGGPESPC